MILPIEKEVVTLETAKKMKALGCRQDSKWFWVLFAKGYGKGHINYERNLQLYLCSYDKLPMDYEEKCSAYTVGEMGELLPVYIKDEIGTFYVYENITGVDGFRIFDVQYREWERKEFLFSITKQFNEAEARGLMWCWLAESGYIKPNAH